jgi:8-oxo-dGTP diphosphatase
VRTPLRATVCVSGAIFRGDRVLLLHRADHDPVFPGYWDMPGGCAEEGESLEEALRREIREETGFSARVEVPYYASTFPAVEARRGSTTPRTLVAVEFLCTVRARREPRLDPNEHSEYAWVGEREARRYRVAPSFRPSLERVFAAERRFRRR